MDLVNLHESNQKWVNVGHLARARARVFMLDIYVLVHVQIGNL